VGQRTAFPDPAPDSSGGRLFDNHRCFNSKAERASSRRAFHQEFPRIDYNSGPGAAGLCRTASVPGGTNRAPLQRYPCPPVAVGDPGSNRTPSREMTPRCRFAHPAPAACRSALGTSCGRPPRSIPSQRRNRIPLLNAAKPLRLSMAKGNGIYIVKGRSRFFAIPRTPALECAAFGVILTDCNRIDEHEKRAGKWQLRRIVTMATKVVSRNESCVTMKTF